MNFYFPYMDRPCLLLDSLNIHYSCKSYISSYSFAHSSFYLRPSFPLQLRSFYIISLPSAWHNKTRVFSFLNSSAFLQLASLFLNFLPTSLVLLPCWFITNFRTAEPFFLPAFNYVSGLAFPPPYMEPTWVRRIKKQIIGMGVYALYIY